MEPLKFFDCNVQVGKRKIVNPGSFHETGELLRKMEHYGIQKALCYHSLAEGYRSSIGNGVLMDEIKGIPNLYPVWVVLPHHTGEFPEPAVLKDELKKNGVKAVRIFPSAANGHNYSMSSWCTGELLSMLEETGVPVMAHMGQLSWDTVHEMLTNHPKLKLILTLLHYNTARNCYPLLKKFKNFYLETIGYKIYEGIEDICQKFGAGRLVFGSGAPQYSGGSAVAMITYASISDGDKQLIASGNLERLLGEAAL
jgi:hypothetical protein